jgi:sialate O-acetylesterase
MVLQRAPQQATVWGFAAPGTVVTTTFDKIQHMKATADSDGIWRQQLPATEASATPHSLTFLASTGETAEMQNVLFGDVYLCGGQSNMWFSMPNITNASDEAVLADSYPLIRLFTVGTKTASKKTPLDDLQTIEQTWSVADHTSIGGHAITLPSGEVEWYRHFSAVCWIFGREVFDALGGSVPIGLVSSNIPGTAIEAWSTKETLQECNITHVDSRFYNAMIIHTLWGRWHLSDSRGIRERRMSMRRRGLLAPQGMLAHSPP